MTALVTKNLPLVAGAPDGIKRLRTLILELAVRGKLVAQDARDEPASELIKLIDAARGHMVQRGRSRSVKATAKSTSSSQLSSVPCGWVAVTLDQITTIRGGSTPSMANAEFWGGDIPWVSPKDMHAGDIFGSEMMITSRALQETNIELVPIGSILLVGRSGILKRKLPAQVTRIACTVNQDIKALTPIAPLDARFVQLLLLGTERQILVEDVKTGTTVQSLVFEKLFSREFGLPPLAEQHRIVAKVDELMALCDRLEADQADAEAAHAQLVQALLGSLTQATEAADFRASWQRLSEHFHTLFTTEASIDALKQTVLQLAVMGRLVRHTHEDEPASELLKRIAQEKLRLASEGVIRAQKAMDVIGDEERLFDLPPTWEWVRLGEICITQTGTTPSKGKPEFFGSDVPFIKPGDLYEDKVNYGGEGLSTLGATTSGRIARGGSLLMVCIGTIGKCNIVERACSFNQQINSATLYEGLSKYLLIAARSPYFQAQAWGLSSSTTIAILNKGNWGSIPVPFPGIEQQHRIVAKVDELMALCDQLKTQLAESRQLHAQLADALVSQAVA